MKTELEKLTSYINERSKKDQKGKIALEVLNDYIETQLELENKIQYDCID